MLSKFKKFLGLQTGKTSIEETEKHSKDEFEDDGTFEDAMETQDDNQGIKHDESSGAGNVTQIFVTSQNTSFGDMYHMTKEKTDCNSDNSGESSSDSEDDDMNSAKGILMDNAYQLPPFKVEDRSAKENDLDECLNEVKFWLKDPNLNVNCNEYLQKLWDCVNDRYMVEGCYDFWVRILNKNRILSDFFVKLRDMEKSNKDNKFSQTRVFLIRLTRPAGVKSFIGSNDLKLWLEEPSSTKIWSRGEINDLASFISVIKGEVLPFLSNHESIHDLQQEAEKERFELFITNQIAEATKFMINGLTKLESKEELVFANIMLMQLHFNLESRVFEIPITKTKLEKSIECIKKKYETFSSKTDIDRQRYIVKSAIAALGNTSQKQREKNFYNLLQPVMKKFDIQIASAISSFASPETIDFEGLSQEIEQIHDKADKLMQGIDLSKVTKSLKSRKEEDNIEPNVNVRHNFKDVNNEILRTFCLECHFPSKIEMQHVMKIERRQLSVEKVTDIPWIILKKLIMLDHRGRDEVLFSFRNKCSDKGPSFSGDLDELVGDVPVNTLSDFNPLDVFFAIFSCCNNFLKQILVEKMFLCQLAVPFLYKSMLSENYELSLWPLRALQIEGEYQPLVSSVTRVISFIRLKRPLHSKSELLSNVLSNGGYKNTFHHHNCFLGATQKQFTDGAVEASWYLSSKNDKEIINENVTCLNLRGDALKHKTQLSFLKGFSDAIFILMSIADLSDPTCKNEMLQMYTSNVMVVLLLTHRDEDGDYRGMLKQFRDEIENHKGRTKVVMLSLNGKNIAEADLKQQIKIHMKTCVENYKGKRLTELVDFAKSLNISIDENEKGIAFGKNIASQILACMEPDLDSKTIKELHFPLQGTLWSNLSKCIKKLSRVNDKKTSDNREKLSEEANEIRMNQLRQCQNLSPVIQRFIETLATYQDKSDMLAYFMKWLSILLKERTVDQNSTMSSIGIEHFMREIGQIYEVVHSLSDFLHKDIVQAVEVLPTVVAKLILNGQAVEVMDGDNSNIALIWIKAVYLSIAQLTNNARILTVSVSGVQSAGKSTLVNALYGLTFTVSSGRCTKGVFMEMVPAETKGSVNNFNYVMVLDCEGLRSQETSASTYDNDNRLATFIIGMSDICLINIKGENYAEMGDVLQVVVHAFFRLKSANRNLKLHQSCLFIHQNVSSEDADKQNRGSKTTFIETLNKITQTAAEEDGYLETTEFNKMINFDHQKHCWYFKDFWTGNPPMAAVNDAYSENVSEVRQYIHSELLGNRSYLTILDLTGHMEDLWNGILTDDFIFSFQSSIHIKAYSKLESKFNEIQWNLEKKLFDLIKTKANEKIRWHSTVEENRLNVKETGNELKRQIKEFTHQSKKQLEDFIEESEEYREIYLTWKPSKMVSLSSLGDIFLEKANLQLEEKQKQMKLDMRRSEMKNELNEQVKTSAKYFYDTLCAKPTEKELDIGFEKNWTEILQQWAHEQLEPCTSIEDQIKEKLFSHFKRKQPILEKELKRLPWNKSVTFKRLEGSITVEDVEKEHIDIKTHLITRRKQKSRGQCNIETVDVTEKILRKADAYLDDLDYIDSKYDDSYINTILDFVDQEIRNHNEKNSEQRKFKILSQYNVRLSVHICRFAMQRFQSMNDKYEEKHNKMAWCKSQKKTAEVLFKNIVQQESEEQFAAVAFGEFIEDSLFRTVIEKVRNRIEQHVCKHFGYSKTVLIKEIMLSFLKKNRIEDLEKYLDDPYSFAQHWITLFMKSNLNEVGLNQHSPFSRMVFEVVNENVLAIEQSVISATREMDRQGFGMTNSWVQHFKRGAMHLQFTNEALKDVTTRNIHDFQSFQTKISNHLYELTQKLQKVICQTYDSCIRQGNSNLYEIVTKKLWGCPESCPFCGEPCKHNDPNHVDHGINHACIQHRPLALNGIHEYDPRLKKDVLVIDPCYVLVRSSQTFNCSWCAYGCQKSNDHSHSETQEHEFKQFREFFPTWEIKASSRVEYYQYWSYILASYAFIFKKKYGYDIKIPSAWKKTNEKKAKESILRSP